MKRTRKNSATRIILEKLGELGFITLDVFFPKKYYSMTHLSRKLFGLDSSPRVPPRTFSSLMWRLKREGLVASSQRGGSTGWNITSKGRDVMKQRFLHVPAVPPPDGIERIVIFDIPERERRKRDAIRAELLSCNFSQLQKSVWIGTNPLADDFIKFLDGLNLKNKVHIFSIRKRGTLE